LLGPGGSVSGAVFSVMHSVSTWLRFPYRAFYVVGWWVPNLSLFVQQTFSFLDLFFTRDFWLLGFFFQYPITSVTLRALLEDGFHM
jgi:hypothetical protein